MVEIQTELDQLPTEAISDISHTEILKIDQFLKRNRYKLHGAVYDATMIAQIEEPIEFELSIGNLLFYVSLIS